VNLGPVVNSPYADQHPALSPDGLSLYITSNRPGGFGDFDIYVSHRETVDEDWGPPENLGPVINTEFEDSVPNISADGHFLYFTSKRPGGFGGEDVWVSFRKNASDDFAWEPPVNLGSGVNTKRDEGGPTIFSDRREAVTTLYFTRCVGDPQLCSFGDPNQRWDIFASALNDDGTFGMAVPVPELNSGYRDTRTAIRNDGLEMLITSSRPGGFGMLDLWDSTRASTLDSWTTPVNLGSAINTESNDGAPSLSCNAKELYFYSNRPGGYGGTDLYVSRRAQLSADDD
jgi:hypothetical protein